MIVAIVVLLLVGLFAASATLYTELDKQAAAEDGDWRRYAAADGWEMRWSWLAVTCFGAVVVICVVGVIAC